MAQIFTKQDGTITLKGADGKIIGNMAANLPAGVTPRIQLAMQPTKVINYDDYWCPEHDGIWGDDKSCRNCVGHSYKGEAFVRTPPETPEATPEGVWFISEYEDGAWLRFCPHYEASIYYSEEDEEYVAELLGIDSEGDTLKSWGYGGGETLEEMMDCIADADEIAARKRQCEDCNNPAVCGECGFGDAGVASAEHAPLCSLNSEKPKILPYDARRKENTYAEAIEENLKWGGDDVSDVEGDDYASRVRVLEGYGIPAGDAQGIVDVENMIEERDAKRRVARETLRGASYRDFEEDYLEGDFFIACNYDLGQGGPEHRTGSDGITEYDSSPQLCREIAFEGIMTDEVTDVEITFGEDGRQFSVTYKDAKGFPCEAEYLITPN